MIATIMALALQAAPASALGLVNLFDAACVQGFPDDARVAAAMARTPVMTPLTRDQLRVYLKNDHGRGWTAENGSGRVVVTLEAPPYHACAVRLIRANAGIDAAEWQRVLSAAQARAGGGFVPIRPQSAIIGGVRTMMIGDQKQLPDGSRESFYVIRTVSAAPKAVHRVAEMRLVHQIVTSGRQ